MKKRLVSHCIFQSFCVSLVFCFWQISAGIAAVPESEGTFQPTPLKQGVNGYLWFIQTNYQDISEQLKPKRSQRKGTKTSLRIYPMLWRVSLEGIQRKKEALKKLGYADRAEKVGIKSEANPYQKEYVAYITIGGQSCYSWSGRFGAARFHGLNPGRHSVIVEIWTDTGEHFKDTLTILVDQKALSADTVKKKREVVEKGRQKIEKDLSFMKSTHKWSKTVGRERYVSSLSRQIDALAKYGTALLERGAAQPSEVSPLIDEALQHMDRLVEVPAPVNFDPQKNYGKSWAELKKGKLLGGIRRTAELLRRISGQQGLTLIGRLLERNPSTDHFFLLEARVRYGVTGSASQVRPLLEKWRAGIERANADPQREIPIGVPDLSKYPRPLKGRTDQQVSKSSPFDVQIIFTDDNQDTLLAPADEARLKFVIQNTSETLTVEEFSVLTKLHDPFKEYQVIRFENVAQGASPFEKSGPPNRPNSVLKPGQKYENYTEGIIVADEKNPWIRKNLIKIPIPQDASPPPETKPSPERGVPLKNAFRVIVHGKLVDAIGRIVDENKKLFDADVSVLDQNGGIQMLTYPDLAASAGWPNGSSDELHYYRRGDIHWCHPAYTSVRTAAVMAARYDYLNNKFGSFPDKTSTIVKNVVYFVYRSLRPKAAPKPSGPAFFLDHELAEMSLKGTLDPTSKHGHSSYWFICQENSYYLGALLRSLGFAVREINIAENWYSTENLGRFYQDAASEVYDEDEDEGYKKDDDDDWHFFALFTPGGSHPRNSHRSYAWWVPTYDVWVGTASYTEKKTARFRMSKWDMSSSPVWRYVGWGDCEEFYRGVPGLSTHWIVYCFWSPLTAVLQTGDGKRIGAEEPVEPSDYNPFLPWKSKKEKILREIQNAYYSPEGVIALPDKADPASGQPLPQTIIVPVRSKEERHEHKLTLIGTGNGPFSVHGSFIDGKREFTELGRLDGEIVAGQRIEITGSDLKLRTAVPASIELIKPTVKPKNDQWQPLPDLQPQSSKTAPKSGQSAGPTPAQGYETIVE